MVLLPPCAALGCGSHGTLEPHMTLGSIYVGPAPAGWPESFPGETWALEVLDCPQNWLWVQLGLSFSGSHLEVLFLLICPQCMALTWQLEHHMKVGIIAVNDLVTVFGLLPEFSFILVHICMIWCNLFYILLHPLTEVQESFKWIFSMISKMGSRSGMATKYMSPMWNRF